MNQDYVHIMANGVRTLYVGMTNDFGPFGCAQGDILLGRVGRACRVCRACRMARKGR